ncbi:hypothetical protein [Rhodospirillum sp. A1_3_36]|uniref:tetratricopeptide repeat protein n=1 Tax=Rhodospirillum sp. A1_3_36 TaxID=3391666 RepID=UPI0039A693B9
MSCSNKAAPKAPVHHTPSGLGLTARLSLSLFLSLCLGLALGLTWGLPVLAQGQTGEKAPAAQLGPFASESSLLNAWQTFSRKAPGETGLDCTEGKTRRILLPADSTSQAHAFCAAADLAQVPCAVVPMTCKGQVRPVTITTSADTRTTPSPQTAPPAPKAQDLAPNLTSPGENALTTVKPPPPREASPIKTSTPRVWVSPFNRTVPPKGLGMTPPEGYRPLNASAPTTEAKPVTVPKPPDAVTKKDTALEPKPSATVAPPPAVEAEVETRENPDPTPAPAQTQAALQAANRPALRSSDAETETKAAPQSPVPDRDPLPDGVPILKSRTPKTLIPSTAATLYEGPAAEKSAPLPPLERAAAAPPKQSIPEPTEPEPTSKPTPASIPETTEPEPVPQPDPALPAKTTASVADETTQAPPANPPSTEGNQNPMAAATAAVQAQNYALAAQLLEPLAEEDDPLALYNLAMLYAAGLGVPRDLQRAFMLTERSARKGFLSAQNNLGVMYLKGIGVTPDREQALHWLNVAAANGNPLAKRSLEALENQNAMPSDPK